MGFIAEYDIEVNDVNSEVILAFFKHISKRYVPSSLWTIYSCVKKMLLVHTIINLGEMKAISEYIKAKNEKYLPKKAESFELKHFLKIKKFLDK